ncbi:MATE family efflux transporter [Nereida sp. MMG025]|uniref:MATE family efflux transporter n=1 Tax=Nereida sp. MMG025 TaxID=2909981 RepID=UPI001F322883|nr:MATE family efflux transporter [Nereida sp. MMG025]MCF6443993.1 MATE family efflux transporter [Nereida sp. MMG025]
MAEPAQPITHKRVWAVALPIVLSNATVPILGAVDTGVVGQLGDPVPIGAVGIGAIILTAFYWFFGFLRMGTAGLTAQAEGADDTGEVAALLSRVLMIGFGAGALIIVFQSALFWAAFQLSPASDAVEAMARDYMAIRVWSAPAMIAIYGITGWLIGQERTRAVLVIQLFMNLLNIVLSVTFVLGFDWGVQGVAWATFVSEWAGLLMGLWLCRAAFNTPAWKDWARIADRAALINMTAVNTDIMIRSVLLQAIFMSFLFFASDLGDVELAANQVLLQFLYITAYAMDGFAFAAEAFVGKAKGARDPVRLRRGALITGLWGAVTCAVLGLSFAVFGAVVIDVMTTAPDVRGAARDYLPYMVAAPFVGVAAWMLDGIFIGATQTRDMRNMMIVSAIVYFGSAMVLLPWLGNHGLWLCLLISFIARGITLGARYPALERAAAA